MSPIAPSPLRQPGRALAIVVALDELPAFAATTELITADREATAADREVVAATRRLERGASPDALVELASAYMRKARETGDPSYYDRAASAVDRALAADRGHYGALRARAWVLLGKHEFAKA